jgi:hypothetical protein
MANRPTGPRGSEKGDRRRPDIDSGPRKTIKGKEPSGRRESGRGAGGRGTQASQQSRGRKRQPR